MVIVLSSFSEPLAHIAEVSDQTKCVQLNDEPCMVRPSLIDLNTVNLNIIHA